MLPFHEKPGIAVELLPEGVQALGLRVDDVEGYPHGRFAFPQCGSLAANAGDHGLQLLSKAERLDAGFESLASDVPVSVPESSDEMPGQFSRDWAHELNGLLLAWLHAPGDQIRRQGLAAQHKTMKDLLSAWDMLDARLAFATAVDASRKVIEDVIIRFTQGDLHRVAALKDCAIGEQQAKEVGSILAGQISEITLIEEDLAAPAAMGHCAIAALEARELGERGDAVPPPSGGHRDPGQPQALGDLFIGKLARQISQMDWVDCCRRASHRIGALVQDIVYALRMTNADGISNVPTFSDGYYRAIVDPTAMMHLRQDSDFREVARYAGQGVVNPMQPELAPNASFYRGMGPAYGQAGFVAGQPVMPTGFLFEGVRWIESTNLPEKSFTATITDASISGAVTPAAPILFFGPQAIGVAVGGNNAQILLNNNDDFSRFICMIWSIYAGFEVLNKDFITVAYSFVY